MILLATRCGFWDDTILAKAWLVHPGASEVEVLSDDFKWPARSTRMNYN